MNLINEPVDVIIIGAGQAGLACGWHLRQQSLRFLILDAEKKPGGNWRNYYDSLKLFPLLLIHRYLGCLFQLTLSTIRYAMKSYVIWSSMRTLLSYPFGRAYEFRKHPGTMDYFCLRHQMVNVLAQKR